MGRHMLPLLFLAVIALLFAMSILNRRKGRDVESGSIRPPLERRLRTGHTGAMTAMQAVEAALMVAQSEAGSADPVLRGVFTGDVDLSGRALSWDVFLALPGHSFCTVLIQADPDEPDPDKADMIATARFRSPSGQPDALRGRYGMGQADAPAFPLDFTDSPEAMQTLMRMGLDPAVSDREIGLSSVMGGQGRPVWQATLGDYSWQAPFAPGEER